MLINNILRFIPFVLFIVGGGVAIADDGVDGGIKPPSGGVTLYMDFYYGDTKIADVTDTLLYSTETNRYRIDSHAIAVGLAKILHGDVIINSAGVLDKTHGLLMTAYAEQRGRRKPRAAEKALGDDTIQLQRGEETRQEQAPQPVFDYLTSIYRSYLLGRPTAGTLSVTNGWKLSEYIYTPSAEETVETGMGDIQAVVLERRSERGIRKIWLAPSLGYLPVRLYIDNKGHIFQTIIKGINKPAATD